MNPFLDTKITGDVTVVVNIHAYGIYLYLFFSTYREDAWITF